MATWFEQNEERIDELKKLVAAKEAYLAFMKANPLFEEFIRLQREASY